MPLAMSNLRRQSMEDHHLHVWAGSWHPVRAHFEGSISSTDVPSGAFGATEEPLIPDNFGEAANFSASASPARPSPASQGIF